MAALSLLFRVFVAVGEGTQLKQDLG